MDHPVDQIREQLLELPDLMTLLPEALTAGSSGGGARGIPGPRPPIRLDVVHLLDERDKAGDAWEAGMDLIDPDRQGVLPYLWGWCRDLEATAYETRPELPPELPEQPTVAGCCTWLADMLDWAQTLPQWPELAHGITTTHRRVQQALRSLTDRDQPVPCRLCSGTLDHVEGTKPLWRCRSCGHQITVQAVTLKQASRITGVPWSTLRDWSRRPGLLPRIADGDRSNLYDLGTVRAVAAEQRLRGA